MTPLLAMTPRLATSPQSSSIETTLMTPRSATMPRSVNYPWTSAGAMLIDQDILLQHDVHRLSILQPKYRRISPDNIVVWIRATSSLLSSRLLARILRTSGVRFFECIARHSKMLSNKHVPTSTQPIVRMLLLVIGWLAITSCRGMDRLQWNFLSE